MVIPDKLLQVTHLSEDEVKTELAIVLFQKNKITLGQASELANMGQFEFQHLLASRKIPMHYGVEDLKEDAKYLGLL